MKKGQTMTEFAIVLLAVLALAAGAYFQFGAAVSAPVNEVSHLVPRRLVRN